VGRHPRVGAAGLRDVEQGASVEPGETDATFALLEVKVSDMGTFMGAAVTRMG
jgi:hypothetical protein